MGDIANISQKSNEIMEKGNKNNLWPGNLSQKDKKQLAYISAQYGLDPFFTDLTVLGGNPYVTASGLKRNAHESDNPPVSIQTKLISKDDRKRHFEYQASLWKKDTPEKLPYIEYGEASPKDCNSQISKSDKDLKAMARTRAINRVIRLAYNISLTSADEISGYDPDTQEIKDVTPEVDTTTSYNKPEKATEGSSAGDMVMPRGKHKGKKLKDLNTHYLKWLSTKWKGEDIKKAAKEVLEEKENGSSNSSKKKKKRKLSEKEKKVAEFINEDRALKNDVVDYLKTYDVKKVDDLDEDLYGELIDLLSSLTNPQSDQELADEISAEMELPFEEEDEDE